MVHRSTNTACELSTYGARASDLLRRPPAPDGAKERHVPVLGALAAATYPSLSWQLSNALPSPASGGAGRCGWVQRARLLCQDLWHSACQRGPKGAKGGGGTRGTESAARRAAVAGERVT